MKNNYFLLFIDIFFQILWCHSILYLFPYPPTKFQCPTPSNNADNRLSFPDPWETVFKNTPWPPSTTKNTRDSLFCYYHSRPTFGPTVIALSVCPSAAVQCLWTFAILISPPDSLYRCLAVTGTPRRHEGAEHNASFVSNIFRWDYAIYHRQHCIQLMLVPMATRW